MHAFCLLAVMFIGCIGLVRTGQGFSQLGGLCDKKTKDGCLKNMQTFLHLTNLPFTSNAKELDKLCERTHSGVNCTSNLMHYGECFSDKERTYTNLYTPLTQYMLMMLCEDGVQKGYLREAFLSNSECMLKNKESIECCAKGTSVADIPVMKINDDMEAHLKLDKQIITTCCPVVRYLQCTVQVARDKCGEAAANFTAEYVRRAAGEQVQGLCQNMPDYPNPDLNTCAEDAPICAGFCGLPSYQILILAAVVIQLSIRWTEIH